MPIYEYKCNSCGKITEKMESIKSEVREIDCPECSGVSERVMSVTNHKMDSGLITNQNPCKNLDDSNPKCQGCPAANI